MTVDSSTRNANPTTPLSPRGPEGIRGWLLLPALGLIVSPFLIGTSIVLELVPALDMVPARTLPWYFVLGEIAANILLILFTLWVAFHFFRRKRATPRLFIMLVATTFVVVVGDALLAWLLLGFKPDDEAIRAVMRPVIATAIWVPYFRRSERVRNTFRH